MFFSHLVGSSKIHIPFSTLIKYTLGIRLGTILFRLQVELNKEICTRIWVFKACFGGRIYTIPNFLPTKIYWDG